MSHDIRLSNENTQADAEGILATSSGRLSRSAKGIQVDHAYVFPAIRGVQAGREYYVSMCPLRIIPRIFLFDEEELSAELRAQRTLNRNRVPDMARYMLKNEDDYVFSALTASIDGEVDFQPMETGDDGVQRLGSLRIPMEARFIINDGQHRRAAIEMALAENPRLGSETIAVVFFVDAGLKRSQQMFADLNRYAVRASSSLGVLYDHRDAMAKLTRLSVFRSDFLKSLVELERTSLSLRSRKLFTLSSLHRANCALLDGTDEEDDIDRLADVTVDFWESVADQIEEWQMVHDNEMTAGELRRDYLCSHSLTLEAIGNIGNELLVLEDDWESKLQPLAEVDWSRSNSADWEGRALNGGKVVNSRQNVLLTTSLLKQQLGLPLTESEHEKEQAFLSGGRP